LQAAKGITPQEIVELVENPTARMVDLPNVPASRWRTDPDVMAVVTDIGAVTDERLAREIAAGVPVYGLQDVLDYMAHLMTDEGRKAIKLANTSPRPIAEWAAKHQHDLRQLKGKTVQQINDMVAKGQLVIDGRPITLPVGAKLFRDNPAEIMAVRGMRGERAIANADLLDRMVLMFGQPTGKAPADWREIAIADRGDLPEYADILTGVKFHPDVADEITRVLEATKPANVESYQGLLHEVAKQALGLFGKDIDLPTYLQSWKIGTLAYRPSYHIANITGNMWNNFLGGVSDPGVYKDAAAILGTHWKIGRAGKAADIVAGGKTYTSQQVLDAFMQKGLGGSGFYGGDITKTMKKATQGNTPSDVAFAAQEKYEQWTRLAHFMDRLKKGDTLDQAAESVRRYLFDYSDLSEADKQVKRFVPFWTFMRKNVPLQAEMLFTEPGKVAAIAKGQNVVEKGQEEMPAATRPEYLQGQAGWQVGRQPDPEKLGGEKAFFLRPGRFLPTTQLFDAASDPAKTIVSALRPELRTPLELYFGKRAYSGAEIKEGHYSDVLGAPLSDPEATVVSSLVPGGAAIDEVNKLWGMRDKPVQALATAVGARTYELDPNAEARWAGYNLEEQENNLLKVLRSPTSSAGMKVRAQIDLDALRRKKQSVTESRKPPTDDMIRQWMGQ
jgi:hypothetical protein